MRETGHNKASRAAALDGVGAPCARQPPPSRHIPCRSAPCARQSTPSRGQGPLPQKQSSHKGKSAQVATRGRSHKSRHSHNGFGFGCCRSTPCARQAPQVAISLVGARPARDRHPKSRHPLWERALRATKHPSRGQGPLPQEPAHHQGFGFGCCRSTPCARQAPQVAISLVGARPARDKAPQVAARGRSHRGFGFGCCRSAPCARQSTPSRGQGPLPQKHSSHKSRHSHNGFGAQVAARGRFHRG